MKSCTVKNIGPNLTKQCLHERVLLDKGVLVKMDGQKRDGFVLQLFTFHFFPSKLTAMQLQSAGKSTVWSFQNAPDLSRRIVHKKCAHKFAHLLIIGAVSVQGGPNLDGNTLKHVTV